MKKNLILMGVLFALLGTAYLLEEVIKPQDDFARVVKGSLFQEDIAFDAIKVGLFEINKQGTKWYLKNPHYLVSDLKLKAIVSKLSEVRFEKEVKRKASFFEKQIPIEMENNGKLVAKFTIGSAASTTGKFYLDVTKAGKTKTYLSHIDGASSVPFTDERERNLNLYYAMLSLVNPTQENYLETSLGYFYNLDDYEQVKIDNNHNRPYSLDLENNTTEPRPFTGLYLRKDFEQVVKTDFSSVHFKEVTPFKKVPAVNNLVSDIVLIGKTERHLSVFTDYDGKEGRFLMDAEKKVIYELNADTMSFFFRPVQEYWNRRVTFAPNAYDQEDILFKFGIGEDVHELHIPSLKEFTVEYEGDEGFIVRQEYFNLVFNLLFGIGPFDQADYATSPAMKGAMVSENAYNLEIFGQEFLIDFKGVDIIVVNKTKNYNLHFHHPFPDKSPQSLNDFLSLD
jgi:hypothetical protein